MDSITLSQVRTGPDMATLIDQYGESLLRLCFFYLKDIHLAEDAMQDTLIKVYQHYGKFKGNASEKTWMMRIAINTCKNYLRSTWRKNVDPLSALESVPTTYQENLAQDDTLLLEIMKLPNKYKEVVLLHYYQDMSVKDIAVTLRCPVGTVTGRLRRARERLEINLKGWYYNV